MGSGSGGSQQSTTMRRGNCMQQLGCELDMATVDLEAIVMATQSCMMMTPPSSATMMTNQQQGSTMTSTSSPAMTGLHPQDCQCLRNAGVQITCNTMGSNQATMTQMNNRGRRSNF
uniref:Uncharacterized protein n=1 Tax=Plectus sambesii TaxID=2011161 RepID=A0A914X384_9BILA